MNEHYFLKIPLWSILGQKTGEFSLNEIILEIDKKFNRNLPSVDVQSKEKCHVLSIFLNLPWFLDCSSGFLWNTWRQACWCHSLVEARDSGLSDGTKGLWYLFNLHSKSRHLRVRCSLANRPKLLLTRTQKGTLSVGSALEVSFDFE